MEGDIARSLQNHLPRIAHVQLADNPGRNEPGTGEINTRSCSAISTRSAIAAGSDASINRGRRPSTASDGTRRDARYLVGKQTRKIKMIDIGFIGLGTM